MSKQSSFYSAISERALLVNQSAAGAGVTGLLGFTATAAVATVLFITENYFLSMFTISIGLLLYVSGTDLTKILVSSFTIFFSNKHLTSKASQIQATLLALSEVLQLKRNKHGEIVSEPIEKKAKISLPDNALVRDIQRLRQTGKEHDYDDYITHSYYTECRELYDFSLSNFDFVANSMPLFGLIGTIVGLISMFDTLGADVTVESLSPQLALALKTTLYGAIFSSIYRIIGVRFEQRQKSLDYDYDALTKGIEVLTENEVVIEVDE